MVAAEVRKLAERSKVAADEINDLSNKGVVVSENAGKKLSEIVPEIEKTAQLVQEISAASIEQKSGADQVNSAIQQLNTVTQQNAAASEELSSSSEELSGQAEQLKEVVSYFKLDSKSHINSTFSKINIHKIPEHSVKYGTNKNIKENKGHNLHVFNMEDDDHNFQKY